MLGFSAWTFFHKDQFAINKETVPISAYNSVVDLALFLMIQMGSYIAVAFLGFRFVVWNAYRKICVPH